MSAAATLQHPLVLCITAATCVQPCSADVALSTVLASYLAARDSIILHVAFGQPATAFPCAVSVVSQSQLADIYVVGSVLARVLVLLTVGTSNKTHDCNERTPAPVHVDAGLKLLPAAANLNSLNAKKRTLDICHDGVVIACWLAWFCCI